MNTLELTVDNPDELLTVYGAAALIRIERATSSTGFVIPNGNGSSAGTELTSVTIVAGDTVYVTYDTNGLSTDWYRLRYSKASPASAGDYGAFSSPFQVIAQGYTSLSRVKTRLKSAVASTGNDDFLRVCVDAVNTFMSGPLGVGMFIGPSQDSLRIYDGCDAVRGGTRLHIPGGIISLTAVRMASSTAGTLASQTLTNFLLRPKSFTVGPMRPYSWVEVSEQSGLYFYPYRENVELTGTFGWPMVPPDLAELADAAVVRMDRARNTGQTDIIALEDGSAMVSRFFSPEDRAKMAGYRHEVWQGVA